MLHVFGRRFLRQRIFLIIGVLILGIAGCANDHASEMESQNNASADNEPVAIDLDIEHPNAGIAEVTELSDAVVRGTVIDLQEDVRLIDEDMVPPGHTIYTVEIEQVLSGELESERIDQNQNTIDVAVWTHEGGRPIQGFESGGPMWVQPGDAVVWFLAPSVDYSDDLYVKAHYYGQLKVNEAGTLSSLNPDSPFGREVDELASLESIEAEIQQAN